MKRGVVGLLILAVLVLFGTGSSARADYDMKSTGYQLDGGVVGSNGIIQGGSTNYQAVSGIGDLGVGSSSSSGYQIEAGGQTSPEPNLSFTIDGSGADFGLFSATDSATATATFSVTNYTSFGYVVQIIGSAPAYNGHALPSLATATAPEKGIEQFGINLVANTDPATIGANPNNYEFGHGTVAAGYDQANKYKYVDGDIIASAAQSSGKTTYTITYLVNVSSLTPGGDYGSHQTLVVTGTY